VPAAEAVCSAPPKMSPDFWARLRWTRCRARRTNEATRARASGQPCRKRNGDFPSRLFFQQKVENRPGDGFPVAGTDPKLEENSSCSVVALVATGERTVTSSTAPPAGARTSIGVIGAVCVIRVTLAAALPNSTAVGTSTFAAVIVAVFPPPGGPNGGLIASTIGVLGWTCAHCAQAVGRTPLVASVQFPCPRVCRTTLCLDQAR